MQSENDCQSAEEGERTYTERVMDDLDALLADLQSTTQHISSYQQQQQQHQQHQQPDLPPQPQAPYSPAASSKGPPLPPSNHHHQQHQQQQPAFNPHQQGYNSQPQQQGYSQAPRTVIRKSDSSTSSQESRGSTPPLPPPPAQELLDSVPSYRSVEPIYEQQTFQVREATPGSDSSGVGGGERMSALSNNLSELDQLLQDLNSAQFLADVDRKSQAGGGDSSGLVNGIAVTTNTNNNNAGSNSHNNSLNRDGKVPPPVAPKPTKPSDRATVESLLDELESAVPPGRGQPAGPVPAAGFQEVQSSSSHSVVSHHQTYHSNNSGGDQPPPLPPASHHQGLPPQQQQQPPHLTHQGALSQQQGGGFSQQQGGFTQQQGGFAQQQSGFAQQQGGFVQPQGGSALQQQGGLGPQGGSSGGAQSVQIQHFTQQVPQQAASSATKELDELMASLSEFKQQAQTSTSGGAGTETLWTAAAANNEPAYAKPMKRSTSSQSAASNPTSPVQGVAGGNLDSMLGDLNSDMKRQGVNTKKKGVCAACNKPIVGQVIAALGRTWHVEHFTCAHCEQPLGTSNFYERDSVAYCEADYHNLFAPRCAYCNGPIVDKCITALEKMWHPEHFFCAQCGRQFGDEDFHEKNGKAYCREDYFQMFAPKCGGCGMPIMENYISALNRQWHPQCFCCWDCQAPFGTGSFYDHDGLPYCETHYHAKKGSLCASCQKPITGRCITAMFKKFHPEHFVCAFCLKQLNKGTFKEQNDKPYCHPCFVKLFG